MIAIANGSSTVPDDTVPHAVVRQDLAGLKTHFALVDIQLELAHAEADATPSRLVEILAAQGIQVSPAHVIVIQAVLRSEKADRPAPDS